MSFHRKGWDQSSSVVQSSPVPEVCSRVSDYRDRSSPGSENVDTARMNHGGTAADTGELHSPTS